MKKIKNLKTKILITVAIGVYAAAMYVFNLPCSILALTGVRCFGCGMTRAVLSVLSLDFPAAFSHHFMFWSLPILYIMFLFDGKIFNKKTYNILLIGSITIGFVINWLIHTK